MPRLILMTPKVVVETRKLSGARVLPIQLNLFPLSRKGPESERGKVLELRRRPA